MLLGERIKELRKEAGWSQGELADKVGTDARQISRYENAQPPLRRSGHAPPRSFKEAAADIPG